MSVNNYKELKEHMGHKIVCVEYGKQNVAIEIFNYSALCETCYKEECCK